MPPLNFETSSWLNWANNLISPFNSTAVHRLVTVCCSTVHIQPHMYVWKIPEDGGSMSNRNSDKCLPDYTALLHRKQQTFGTEVNGPSFTLGSPVSLVLSCNFVECESEPYLLFSLAEA